ncbi:MAG: tetratricopeptide repeat protein, partial [Muribaculaceae bacterium]|nr:tetratricopeptide repeat protein [Muribaculaceae bacterium]
MTIATVSGIAAKPKEVKRPDSYYFMRGIEAAQDGNTQDALEYLNKELSEHPDNGYAHFWIGSLRYGNDEYGRALTSLDAAIKKIPKKDPEYLSGVYYVRAKTYAALEDTAKCLADMASAIKIYPDDADYKAIIALDQGSVMGYMGLGRNANAQKRWEDAIKQFDYVAKLYNDYSSAYSFRAE